MRIENEFNMEMMEIYHRALIECNYNASILYNLIATKGCLKTAKRLITKDTFGFNILCELNRLDLTIESLVLKEKYACLFTPAEITLCTERLKNASQSNIALLKKTVYPISGQGKPISYYEEMMFFRYYGENRNLYLIMIKYWILCQTFLLTKTHGICWELA